LQGIKDKESVLQTIKEAEKVLP